MGWEILTHVQVLQWNGILDCEGLPTIILEALSNSCLVIASNHSGIPEIIKPNITGFMFRENDHNELANLIIKAKVITSRDIFTPFTITSRSF